MYAAWVCMTCTDGGSRTGCYASILFALQPPFPPRSQQAPNATHPRVAFGFRKCPSGALTIQQLLGCIKYKAARCQMLILHLFSPSALLDWVYNIYNLATLIVSCFDHLRFPLQTLCVLSCMMAWLWWVFFCLTARKVTVSIYVLFGMIQSGPPFANQMQT